MGLFSFLSPSSSSSTASSTSSTTNSETLTANTGTGGSYLGQTVNVTDAGQTQAALDAGTLNLSNLINFANNNLAFSNDIASKSLGLAAAASGSNNAIVSTLTKSADLPTAAATAETLKQFALPGIIAAAVAAFYFLRKG